MQPWFLTCLFIVMGGVTIGMFVQCFRKLHHANLMRDIPTSRIRSAAQGYVELEGTGRLMPGQPIVCPLSGSHCLWWKYSVHRREKRGKTSSWRAVHSGTSDDLFYLDDGSDVCVIDPDGAQIIPTRSYTWHGNSAKPDRGPRAGSPLLGGEYRYHEQLILAGGPLYAIGNFRTQQARSESDPGSRARELLVAWKQDQAGLLKRFDTNNDGQIDAREWEAARRVAHMQAEREYAQNPPKVLPALNIMSRSVDQPYLISGVSQAQLTRRSLWEAGAYFCAFLVVGSGFVWLLFTQGLL